MSTYIMRIRPRFIESIRNGIKKHEYRLAEPERMKIRLGDTIVLVSNQNPEDYVRVFVNSVSIFKGWDEALDGRWENDFRGTYSSYDELIRECHKTKKSLRVFPANSMPTKS